jgi:tight adherence protein B
MAALGTLAALTLPYAYVLHLRRKRLLKIEVQFSDSLDSLARAMRGGNTLLAALQIVAAETAEPLAGELRIVVEERSLGRSWDDALDGLIRRTPLVEISIFAAAVKLQNRTGGKLSEVLARIAETLRDSDAIKSEVRSIAAHGKLTGKILTVLPILIAALMAAVNPGYFKGLLSHPYGRDLVALGAASLCLAHLVIRKMVDIKL